MIGLLKATREPPAHTSVRTYELAFVKVTEVEVAEPGVMVMLINGTRRVLPPGRTEMA